MDIRYRFVNDMILAKDLSVTHIASGQNPSDVMTKNVPHASFSIHEKMIKDGNLGSLYDLRNTEDVKSSGATVVSVDNTTSVVCPSSTPDNGQVSTGSSSSDGSQINTCEDGWTLVKSKPQKYNSNFVGITSVHSGTLSKMQELKSPIPRKQLGIEDLG